MTDLEKELTSKIINLLKTYRPCKNNKETRQKIIDGINPIINDYLHDGSIGKCIIHCNEENNSPEDIKDNKINILVSYSEYKNSYKHRNIDFQVRG